MRHTTVSIERSKVFIDRARSPNAQRTSRHCPGTVSTNKSLSLSPNAAIYRMLISVFRCSNPPKHLWHCPKGATKTLGEQVRSHHTNENMDRPSRLPFDSSNRHFRLALDDGFQCNHLRDSAFAGFFPGLPRCTSGLDGIIPENITEKFHPYLVRP
jgi:hypothetical protein